MTASAPGPEDRAVACDQCLARVWLLGRLAGNLDFGRSRLGERLALGDGELIDAVGGDGAAALRGARRGFDPDAYRAGCAAAGVAAVCRCSPAYPNALRALGTAPAVLHVAGGMDRFIELCGGVAVAIVGARAAPPYGLEMARMLARGISRAGVTVVSGLARGVDAAAHEGALEAGARTIAVLAAAPHRPYPARARQLHRRIVQAAVAVSELGPDVAVRRWMFPARNRIIAGLSAMTVVVAARKGSGALLTAGWAAEMGRDLGAVPGSATASFSWGPHRLLRNGARLVAEPADVLGAVLDQADRPAPAKRRRVEGRLQPLLDALTDGFAPPEAIRRAGLDAVQGLAALAELELTGAIRRQSGGGFSITY